MRIYENCFEMHSEEKRNLHEMGTIVHPKTMQDKEVGTDEDYRTLELSPAVFQIIDGRDRDRWLGSLGLDVEWGYREIDERMDPLLTGRIHNPGTAWERRLSIWKEFLHGGKFSYTYSERFGELIGGHIPIPIPMIAAMMDQLDRDPDTRHGILPVFNAKLDGQYLNGERRIPCSMHYQFMRRNDALECIYVMRSTDFITHFPYDIWLALELQSRLARIMLKIEPGRFTFFTGSLHIYAKDADTGVF